MIASAIGKTARLRPLRLVFRPETPPPPAATGDTGNPGLKTSVGTDRSQTLYGMKAG